MPKISIVVPVYKVEQYLPQCVASLTGQTLREIEIILVDDGSPDRCGALCDEFAAQDPRIKVIHKENGGVSAARNDGLAAATGEYVIFCDSDDWMETTACETLCRKADESGAEIIIGDVYQSDGEHHRRTYFYAHDFVTEDRAFLDQMIQADFYRTYCPLPDASGPAFGYGGPWNKAVKRSLLQENGIAFDLRLKGIFDDILYTAHILAVASKVAYVREPVYYYRQVASSITASYKPNRLEINDAIFTAWREFIEEYGTKGQFKAPFAANVVRCLVQSLPVYFFHKKNQMSKSEVLAELKKTIASEPYYTAAKTVDRAKLLPYHKAVAVLMKAQNASAIRALYFGKEAAKKLLKGKK